MQSSILVDKESTKPYRSITLLLIAAITGVVLCFNIIALIWQDQYSSAINREHTLERISVVADSIEFSAEILSNSELNQLQKLIYNHGAIQDINLIDLYNHEGIIIASSHLSRLNKHYNSLVSEGKASKLNTIYSDPTHPNQAVWSNSSDDKLYQVRRAIGGANLGPEEAFGVLSIEFNLSRYQHENRRYFWNKAGGVALQCLLMIVIIFFVLQRNLTKPIRSLAKACEDAVKFGYFHIPKNLPHNEIARLAWAFESNLIELHNTHEILNEKEALLNVAINASITGFAILDTDCSITDANNALCRWLRREYGELLNQPIWSIVNEPEQRNAQARCHSVMHGEQSSIEFEIQCQRKNGPLIWGLIAITAVHNNSGEVRLLVANVVDIQKLKELSMELEAQNTALAARNEELDQFAYIASHDLKEPLRTMRTFCDHLTKDLSDNRAERVEQDTQFITDAAVRMTRLVDDLLLLSRASHTEYELEPITLRELIEEVCEQLQALIMEKQAEITLCDDLPTVIGDASQLNGACQACCRFSSSFLVVS